MRAFYLAWSGASRKLPQAVAEIPWGHNILLLAQKWRSTAGNSHRHHTATPVPAGVITRPPPGSASNGAAVSSDGVNTRGGASPVSGQISQAVQSTEKARVMKRSAATIVLDAS